MLKRLLFVLCALSLSGVPANALREIQLTQNPKHKALFKLSAGGVKFGTDIGLLAMKDPRCPASDSSIRIRTDLGDTGDVALPCQNWQFKGTKYVYTDPLGTKKGLTSIGWKSQKMGLKFKAGAYGELTSGPLAGPIQFMEVRVTVHDKTFCGRFTGNVSNITGKISAKGATACDPLPPTATPTPTLTLSPTITQTPSLTQTPSRTFTPSLSPTPSLTFTPSLTPTNTPTPTQPPRIVINSPSHGLFLPKTTSSITVSGTVTLNNIPDPSVVTVNGVPVGVQPNGSFTTTIPVSEFVGGDTSKPKVFNPIVAQLYVPNTGFATRDRHVVIVGDSLPDGNCLSNSANCATNSIALRINDSGFNTLEPVIASLVSFDPSTLLGSSGDQIIDSGGYGNIKLHINHVTLQSFGISIDSQTNQILGDIKLTNLNISLHITGDSGLASFLGVDCDVTVDPAETHLVGTYNLQQLASNHTQVDVVQLSHFADAGNINFNNSSGGDTFHDTVNCNGFFGWIVNLVFPDVKNLMASQLGPFLDATDGNGNTPIAGAIEGALGGVEISGPIGAGLNLNLQTPFHYEPGVTDGVDENTTGITLRTDSSVTAAPPITLPLSGSYAISQPFPPFSGDTPVSHKCYGLGLCMSATAFNQMLKGEIEHGLLATELTQLDLDGAGGNPPVDITAALLAQFLPEFAPLGNTPMKIKLQPTLAPLVTSVAGPNGELADLRVSQLLIDLVSCSGPSASNCGTETLQLRGSVDTRVGVNLTFNNATGGLDFAITTPAISDIQIVILANPIGVDETVIGIVLPNVVAPLLPSLSSALGSFPVPSFFGLKACGVESSRNGGFMSVFLNLTAAQTCPTAASPPCPTS